jgi:hypothetical protein
LVWLLVLVGCGFRRSRLRFGWMVRSVVVDVDVSSLASSVRGGRVRRGWILAAFGMAAPGSGSAVRGVITSPSKRKKSLKISPWMGVGFANGNGQRVWVIGLAPGCDADVWRLGGGSSRLRV